MELGEKIKELRERAGLTQEELAARMEVQRNTVWRWENKKANLKADNIQRLSEVLKVDTAELMKLEQGNSEVKVTSNLPEMKVPTKVVLSTEPSTEITGRLIARDGDFYLNLPETAEGYATFIHVMDMRRNLLDSVSIDKQTKLQPIMA